MLLTEQLCRRSDGQPLTLLMYLPWKCKIYFRWCRLSCVWYIPSTLSITSHCLKCHLNLHYHGVHCIPQWYVLSFACIFYARQLLTASCGIIVRQCIIYYSFGFPSRKELALLEMCNQLWSGICVLLGLHATWNGNSYHHCPAWPLKMGLVGCPETSVAN